MTEKNKKEVEKADEETANQNHTQKENEGDREEKLKREVVRATEEFFTGMKKKYGGYEEVFREVGIEVMKKIREEIRREEAILEELDDETRRMVEAVGKEEGLEIQGVEEGNRIITITAGGKEFIILRGGEEQGEEMARKHLEDGKIWKTEIRDGDTTLGLDDWIDNVLEIDGWDNEICSYDRECRYATTEKDREVVYYRSV